MTFSAVLYAESGERLFPGTPVSFSLIHSTDTPIASLKIIFGDEDLFSRGIAGIDGFLGDTFIFSGLVDEQELLINAAGRWVTLTCRSRAALLCDNEALPAQYLETGIDSIFERHVRPYGFSEMRVSRQPPLPSFLVAKGDSELDVLARFCLLSGYPSPRFTPDGCLILTDPKGQSSWQVSNTAKGAIPFLSVSKKLARHTCISEIYLKNHDGIYCTVIENPHAIAHGIRRRRYLAPAREWAMRDDLDAKRRIRSSMYNRLLVEAELPGLYGVSLYDQVLLCYDGMFEKSYLVLGYKLQRNAQGDSTTVVLTEPDYLL